MVGENEEKTVDELRRLLEAAEKRELSGTDTTMLILIESAKIQARILDKLEEIRMEIK